MEKLHHVYVLYKINPLRPVYIGCSSSLKSRIYKHKKEKDFDGVFILESFKDVEHALACEICLIKFFSAFKNESIVNGLFTRYEDMEHLENMNNKMNKIIKGEI